MCLSSNGAKELFLDNDRGPSDYINIRISHSGSEAEFKGDTRNHGILGFSCLCGPLGPK